jgi:hypothetical protein
MSPHGVRDSEDRIYWHGPTEEMARGFRAALEEACCDKVSGIHGPVKAGDTWVVTWLDKPPDFGLRVLRAAGPGETGTPK